VNRILVKTLTAAGTIANRRLVKFGSNEGEVVQAAAASDAIIGVADCPNGAVSGDKIDIVLLGLCDVEFGGTVSAGALVTSDASGRAVAAAPATGANVRIAGASYQAAVSGDIARVMLATSMMQG